MLVKIGPRLATALQIAIHVSALTPMVWVWWTVLTSVLGDPVQYLTHYLGIGALRLLLLSLCITPLAKWLHSPALVRLRRPLGMWCFVWASAHFGVWIVFDLQFLWAQIISEIIERNYLLVGFAAWLILLPLALTSFKLAQRRLGKRWKQLHHWVYPAVLLGGIHFYWSVKSDVFEPIIYLAVGLLLLALRWRTLSRWLR